VHLFGDERCMLAGLRIDEGAEVIDDLGEVVFGGTVEVIDADACRQTGIVRVVRGECRCGLGRQLVEFTGLDAVVEALMVVLVTRSTFTQRVSRPSANTANFSLIASKRTSSRSPFLLMTCIAIFDPPFR